MSYLASLPEDPVVRKSVKEQVPFSILYPNAAITKKLKQMVSSFTDIEVEETRYSKPKYIHISIEKSIFEEVMS